MPDKDRASSEDLDRQIDAFAEVESIDNRLRWAQVGGIERFLLNTRRAELMVRINLWNRQFAQIDDPDEEDAQGHAVG